MEVGRTTTFCPTCRSPSCVGRAQSPEWNFPHECHVSCPVRAASPGAPPGEPSQPLRLAGGVPGAGQGFRLLQFTASVSSGARGRPLVGSRGVHLGIVTKGITRGPGGACTGAGFAVPIETVIGSANGGVNRALGSGAARQMTAIRVDR
jgi:hypothetical protein